MSTPTITNHEYVYMWSYVCICVHMCVFVCICVHMCAYVWVHMFACVHTHGICLHAMCICGHMSAHVLIRGHMWPCVCICVHMCTYVCIYVHVHITSSYPRFLARQLVKKKHVMPRAVLVQPVAEVLCPLHCVLPIGPSLCDAMGVDMCWHELRCGEVWRDVI